MRIINLLSLMVCSWFAWVQVSFAVTLPGESAPNPYDVNSTGVVQRGGVVDTVDLSKRILVVDGVIYHFRQCLSWCIFGLSSEMRNLSGPE